MRILSVMGTSGLKDGGQVRQDVHLAKVGRRAFYEGRCLALLGQVGPNLQRIIAQTLNLSQSLFGWTSRGIAVHRPLYTFCGEGRCHGPTQTHRVACDQTCLAL